MSAETWLRAGFRPVVVALMMACLVQALVGVVAALTGGVAATYLVAFAVLVTLEAFYSYRLIRSSRMMQLTGAWKYRAVEALVLFFLLQVASNLAHGRLNVLAGIPRLDLETLGASVLMGGVWLGSS
ncbi:MAG: hypothetical protein M3281_05735, partial [Chloroflexota bacterium]|nr:hypothetical protein [Chloroflexota bacterium]